MHTQTLVPVLASILLSTACQRAAAQASGTPMAAAPASAVPAPFATPPVLPGTPDVATLVARVKPSVVTITTTHEVKAPLREFEFPFGFGGGPMFGRRGLLPGAPHDPGGGEAGDGDGPGRTLKQRALGSGFLVDGEGHVVTNAHVVEGADGVRVKLSDDREFDAKVKGRDDRLDLAVLELVGDRQHLKELPSVSLGSSEALRVGEYVVAIGNPFGLGDTVTMGIVSAKSRSIGAGPYDDFIQTDASINPGNSGGPLFNLRGQVVGINTAINPQGRGIGFAIPVDAVKDVVPQLLASGHVARGRLGVVIQPVDKDLAKALGLDHPKGALVGDVESGGPAEHAGLRSGDVIVSVDGQEVAHGSDLPRMVARHTPGTKVALQILREGKGVAFDVMLDSLRDEKREALDRSNGPDGEGAATPKGGLGIGLSDAVGGGATIERVVRGSPAEGRVEQGDVIVEVNRTPVHRAADVVASVQSSPAGVPVLLKVKREGRTRFVAIEK